MNWLYKIAIFSAPIFVICLIIYFVQHREFQRDFQTENVRFEEQFQTEFENFGNDTFLPRQKELAEKYWQEKTEEQFFKLEQELHSSIKEAEKEFNSTNSTFFKKEDLKKFFNKN